MASEHSHEKVEVGAENKQPTGKIFGVRYIFPFDVYPRYSYLQSWTARLVPRFRQKIETNGLQECVCDGYDGLEEIKAAEKRLEKPTVTVFSNRKSSILDLQKYLVTTFKPFECDKLSASVLTWNDLVNERNGSSDFDSRVLVIIARDTDKGIFEKLSNLSEVQQESTLVYNPSTKSHRLYKKKRNSGLETMNTSRTLSHAIQTVFELKVVTLLEKIATYMEPLVPRDSLGPDTSLLEDITGKLKQFEICCLKQVIGGRLTSSKYHPGDSQGRSKEGTWFYDIISSLV